MEKKKRNKVIKAMQEYKYHYGLKMRIYPSTRQKNIIRRNSDVSRFVYNEFVAINKEISLFGKPQIFLSVVTKRIDELKAHLSTTALKDRFPWLRHADVDSLGIANAIQNYRAAWNMFRKVHSTGVPCFHKKGYRESYQTNPHYAKGTEVTLFTGTARFLDEEHLSLPKLKRIRCKGSKRMLQRLFAIKGVRIGTITISKDIVGHYFVSLQLASDMPFVDNFAQTGSHLGIDLNIENFYADSDGNIIANPKYYRKQKRRLANAQRKLSRRIARAKKEGRSPREAKNIQKQRLIVARITTSVMARRRNFLHNISTALIKNHDVVVAEELRSRNLLKNHALAMSIQDNGWRTFLSMLAYKAKLHGKSFVTVNPKNTTQTCHVCGHIMAGKDKLTLAVRAWDCPECGTHHVRDVNAAKNILAKGLAKLAI